MRKYLIPESGNFYKANLHCHSVISDGKLTVEELKTEYMKKGYSIIAYTDHDKYVDHCELSDENFLAITAYESDISDNEDPSGKTRRCYHFNCFDKKPNKSKKSIEPRPNYNDIDAINKYIEELNENNFLVCYNHPNWSLQTFEDYKDLKGLFATEIFNFSAYIDGIDADQEIPYDTLLRRGNKIFCVATDDNHDIAPIGDPLNDSFGGFVVIKAENLKYDTIMTALEKGDFYASMAPEIKELYVENNQLFIKTSAARKITMTTFGRRAGIKRAINGETINAASFDIDDDDKYIRIQVEDVNGLRANSNAYFLESFR